MAEKWYQRSRRRILLDFHIADWDERFLSKFDPAEFAECVRLANATAATVFANTHSGLCNYPTRVGAVHRSLKGRDLLGDMIDECHKREIDVVVYYCTIYVEHYWLHHPEARTVDAGGESLREFMGSSGRPRRFCTCCMNDPAYREFVVAQLEEICTGYEFEGVWPDMTFWPKICYCTSCRERYRSEAGSDLPRTIDWRDPAWVGFQRTRQRWLKEFAHLVTSTIRRAKPAATVAHQSGAFAQDWASGVSADLADETDWLSADLYGERYGLSFLAKLFRGMSTLKPFEHINTWCWPDIHEHVVTRTEDHLRLTAFSALANDGAMTYIDAVDPDGTVHKRNYLAAGRVFAELERHEKHAGGTPLLDVAVYYSHDSSFDPDERGTTDFGDGTGPWAHRKGRAAHREAAMNLGKTLVQAHVPFDVFTKKDIGRLSDCQVLALPNATMLDEEEMEAIRGFVRAGGGLYASKHTSLITKDGRRQDDFMLSDLFGASYEGETTEIMTYLTPSAGSEHLFGSFSADYPVTLRDTQLKVKLAAGARALATLTLPYTDPKGTKYAAMLTDPPGVETGHPSVVANSFGKGRVIYAAGVLEIWDHDTTRAILVNLLRELAGGRFWFETDAPKAVEVMLYEQEGGSRRVVHLLNYQQELPNIPIRDFRVSVRTDDWTPHRLVRLPSGEAVDFSIEEGRVEFSVAELRDYLVLALE